MVIETGEFIIFSTCFFMVGRLLEHNKSRREMHNQKAAFIRTINCFYIKATPEETMIRIAKDAIALGCDLNKIDNSLDLYQKWLLFRNHRMTFPTDKYPVSKYKSYKLNEYSIYTPSKFNPIIIDLDRFKELKSYNSTELKDDNIH